MVRWLALLGALAVAGAADDGRPPEWDDEEDGPWEPVPWEPVWWTKAGEQGVRFIERYDETEPDMVYRSNGFRRAHRAAAARTAPRRGAQVQDPRARQDRLAGVRPAHGVPDPGRGLDVRGVPAGPAHPLGEEQKKAPQGRREERHALLGGGHELDGDRARAPRRAPRESRGPRGAPRARSTWEIVCTPELGYKEKAKPGVPPHSVLIFRLTLAKCAATREIPAGRREL